MDIKLRNMASVFIEREDRVLLMYRVGSRAVPPSWVGVGGHFEPEELGDPKTCVLRELREEIGLLEEDLMDLHLRYIVLHRLEQEIRQNYDFFAKLRTEKQMTMHCDEGDLSWQKLSGVDDLTMPRTAKGMLHHYRLKGQYTTGLYTGISGKNGVEFFPLEDVGSIL